MLKSFKTWEIIAHMCVSKRLFCGTHFQLTPVFFFFFFPTPSFFFLKNLLHDKSCECTKAATDDGPEMIQWWCYEAILTVIQLDFAEVQLRKWALKPEHVNICQPIDLLPIIPPLYANLVYKWSLFVPGIYKKWSFYSQIAFVRVICNDVALEEVTANICSLTSAH